MHVAYQPSYRCPAAGKAFGKCSAGVMPHFHKPCSRDQTQGRHKLFRTESRQKVTFEPGSLVEAKLGPQHNYEDLKARPNLMPVFYSRTMIIRFPPKPLVMAHNSKTVSRVPSSKKNPNYTWTKRYLLATPRKPPLAPYS